ncbi:hypothetical protein [Actinoplanes auranticolor]|nr:hypothetical protein [Actinoplanes auranticolor]
MSKLRVTTAAASAVSLAMGAGPALAADPPVGPASSVSRRSRTRRSAGTVLHRTGDRAGAADALAVAVERSREVGSRLGMATGLVFLGTLRRENGDPTAAIETLTEAIDLVRDLGVRGGEVEALNELGAAYRALALAQEIDSAIDEAHSYAGLGRTELAADRRAAAGEHLRAALALFTKVGTGEAAEVAAELERLDAG